MMAAAPSVRPLRILVVEDKPTVAAAIARVLGIDGHRVEIAANGLEAFDRLVAERYDVVLCDIRMPGLDGLALYRAVERTDRDLARRIGFVTGDPEAPDVRAFAAETGAPVVGKPITLAEARQLLTALAPEP
jgi:two-component system NtrC family sensor kinase